MEEILRHDKILLERGMTMKLLEAEVSSLRSSRHEYGNWLNRHNLEVNALQLQTKDYDDTASKFESSLKATENKFETALKLMSEQMVKLQLQVALTSWKVGLIIGGLLFLLTEVAKRVHIP